MNYGIHIKISTGSIHGPGTPSVRMATCTSCTPTTPELPPASDTPRVAESQVITQAVQKYPTFQIIYGLPTNQIYEKTLTKKL